MVYGGYKGENELRNFSYLNIFFVQFFFESREHPPENQLKSDNVNSIQYSLFTRKKPASLSGRSIRHQSEQASMKTLSLSRSGDLTKETWFLTNVLPVRVFATIAG